MSKNRFHRPSTHREADQTPHSIFDENQAKSEVYVDDDEGESDPTVTVTQRTEESDAPMMLITNHHANNHSS